MPDPNRIAVVLNPASGSWKRLPGGDSIEGRKSLIRSWFGQALGAGITVFETRYRGDGANCTRAALDEGCETVVAAGGDGTVREVIEGLHGAHIGRLGILPLGTANVLARSLKIPLSSHEEAASAVAAGRELRIDLGECSGSVFALHAGIGLDGAVVRTTSPRLKRQLGRVAYVANSVRTAIRTGPATVRISIDGATVREYNAYQVLVANVSEYGGSMRLGDHIRATDGLLDLIVCKSRGSAAISALLDGLALSVNRLTLQPSIEYYQVRSVQVSSSRQLAVQLDGDPSGCTPVDIRVLPDDLTVIIP